MYRRWHHHQVYGDARARRSHTSTTRVRPIGQPRTDLSPSPRVLLRLPPLTAYPWLLEAHPAYGVSTAPYVDGKARSALARRHLNLVERCSLGQQASLVGYELLSGPRAGDLQGRLSSAAVAAWEAWSLTRHGDAEARDA